MFCRVTGKSDCKCNPKPNFHPIGSALMVDMKAALRSVFTDHAVYTSWLIVEKLPDDFPSSKFVATRLLRNPKDINDLLKYVIGENNGKLLEDLFTEHLTLAAGLLDLLLTNQSVEKAVDKFLANGDKIGSFFHSFSPEKITLKWAQQLMRDHNNFVINLATLRKNENWEEYIETYDRYFAHMMMFSDNIYELLTP